METEAPNITEFLGDNYSFLSVSPAYGDARDILGQSCDNVSI